jgi:predicted nucleotidyltransferase
VNYGLTEQQLAAIRTILGRIPSIESASIFGSRALGTFSPASDVDIALMGETVSLREQLQLCSMLNEIDALLQFDVVRCASITNRKLLEHIQKYGREIYRKDSIEEKVA